MTSSLFDCIRSELFPDRTLFDQKRVLFFQSSETHTAFALTAWAEHKKEAGPIVVVCPDNESLFSLASILRALTENKSPVRSEDSRVQVFPDWSRNFYEETDPAMLGLRMSALLWLKQTGFLLTTLASLVEHLPLDPLFSRGGVVLKRGSSATSFDSLPETFRSLGYRPVSLVSQTGEFASFFCGRSTVD